MEYKIRSWARNFRSWLLGEAKSEIRAHQNLEWVTRHIRVPIPTTTYSLQPVTINWIINDIIINKRSRIVELGSGTSTQLIAEALKHLREDGIDRQLLSLDENQSWAEHVAGVVEKDGNSAYATVKHIPRAQGSGGYWYDETILDKALDGFIPDVIIVDGPSIHGIKQKADRSQAFKFFRDRMAENYAVFVDDTFRAPERKMIMDWSKHVNQQPSFMNAYLGVVIKGKGFASRPR